MSSTLTVTNLTTTNVTATNLTDGGGTTSTFANVASGSAKMWISFNGTGTPAIYESLNVSSLTDVNTGRFLGNFSNSFSSLLLLHLPLDEGPSYDKHLMIDHRP